MQHIVCRAQNLLRITALHAEPERNPGEDAVPDSIADHPIPNRRDHTGSIATGYIRQIRHDRVGAAAHVGIGGVDPGGLDVDHDFTLSRRRIVDVVKLQDLGPAEGMGADDFHVLCSPWMTHIVERGKSCFSHVEVCRNALLHVKPTSA